MDKKAVILANGAYPTHEIPLRELQNSNYIVCCDGAINQLEKANLQAYAIVGDLDSLKKELRQKYKDIIHHYPDQNSNDLSKAVNWCVQNGFSELVIVGATGHRDDHMIGNVFLLPRYAEKAKVEMLTSYGRFTPILQSRLFKSYKGQQVSVFSPDSETLLTTKNLRYPLQDQKLEMMWEGTLNESMGEHFQIEFKGQSLLVYQAY